MKWPEKAFGRVKVEYRHPLSAGKANLAMILSQNNEENAGLINMAEKAFGDIEDLIVEGTVVGGYVIYQLRMPVGSV